MISNLFPKNGSARAMVLMLLGKRKDLDPETVAMVVADTVKSGAKLVGGRCEIGPPHIARLHDLIS
jgi:S-methylmethionine-dependent homocysteine/selenocysteine methylase